MPIAEVVGSRAGGNDLAACRVEYPFHRRVPLLAVARKTSEVKADFMDICRERSTKAEVGLKKIRRRSRRGKPKRVRLPHHHAGNLGSFRRKRQLARESNAPRGKRGTCPGRYIVERHDSWQLSVIRKPTTLGGCNDPGSAGRSP